MPARKEPAAPLQANLYVVARFLDRLAEPGKAWTRASLQAACGVNYDIFRRYLELLERKGYATVAKNGRVALTMEGKAIRAQLQAVLAEFLAHPPGGKSLAGPTGAQPGARGTQGTGSGAAGTRSQP